MNLSLAQTFGLHLLYKREFHEVFQDEQENPEFKSLLHRMKVVDAQGASSMTEEQWEAASTSTYTQFLFALTRFLPRYLRRLRV